MPHASFSVAVQLNKATFRRFAWFDAFVQLARWKRMVGFTILMVVFAAIVLFAGATVQGSVLLAVVLLAVGLVLPGAYLLHFWLSLNGQCQALGLYKTKTIYAYTLHFTKPDEITVCKGNEKVQYQWSDIHQLVYRTDCAYLYVTPRRAYLLPYAQILGGRMALEQLAIPYKVTA